MFIPNNNYPLFLNLLTTFVYVPASFAYIVPMMRYGKLITPEAVAIPQYKWAVMGFLDSVAGIMQSLSVNYIHNGTIVTLLTQFAIPASMIISFIYLKTRYKTPQYIGAVIVAIGIVIVLLPTFLHPESNKGAKNPIAWSIVLILSCVPMCLSRYVASLSTLPPSPPPRVCCVRCVACRCVCVDARRCAAACTRRRRWATSTSTRCT
jgi:uncharacterized membrane protein